MAGVERGKVVLFTGPTGAGKSTCAQAWAESRGQPTGWYDHDEARFVLKSGYVSRRAAAADPSLRPEADRQWLLAAEVCEAIATTYIDAGVDFSLSAFRPPGQWQGCWARLDQMQLLVIVLCPPVEVALARDATRVGRAHTGEASIRRAYSYAWHEWRSSDNARLVDNSEMSVPEVVALVESLTAER